jgi:hypothetical protein
MGSGLKALVEKSPTSSVEQSRLTAKMMILAVMGKADIYRENRIQESEFRIQEKSSSCLFSWTGVTAPAMSIYRENSGQSAVGSGQL